MNLKEPIVLLANGSFPTHKVPKNLLNRSKSIICLDGAVNNLIKKNLTPNLIIGDLDSILPKYQKNIEILLLRLKNKMKMIFEKAYIG